jgi:hypothetical protein
LRPRTASIHRCACYCYCIQLLLRLLTAASSRLRSCCDEYRQAQYKKRGYQKLQTTGPINQ